MVRRVQLDAERHGHDGEVVLKERRTWGDLLDVQDAMTLGLGAYQVRLVASSIERWTLDGEPSPEEVRRLDPRAGHVLFEACQRHWQEQEELEDGEGKASAAG